MRTLISPYTLPLLKVLTEWMLIVLFLGISGCKKHDIASTQNNIANKTQSNIVDKIVAYLESQKITAATTTNAKATLSVKNANIDLLKENLDFTGARTEQLDSWLDLLIVPIKDEVINKKNLDKNSTLTLLLITDKLGKINSGSIVYFLPSDRKKHNSLPQNTFKNMFSGKAIFLDGIYRVLSVTGKWLSQAEIRDGKLYSTANIQQKSKVNKTSQRAINNECTDWYIVTSYYENGILVDETWEYIGTTCENSCNDPNYQSLCPDDGSGGDGGSGGGVGENPPIVEESQSEMLITSTESAPSFDGPDDGATISTSWHSLVLIHSTTILGIPWVVRVAPQKPFPVPVFVPFWSNTYGDMYCGFTCSNWTSIDMRLTNISFLVSWRWDEIRTYFKLDGSNVGSQTFPGKTGTKVVSK